MQNMERRELLALIKDLHDTLPCRLDHHGHCQEHGWTSVDPECPHKRAVELLEQETMAAYKGNPDVGMF